MEKTIREELNKNILSSELLNDNSLLVVNKDENSEYPIVSIRYVEDSSIKEARIATLLPTIAVQHNEHMVAVFIKNQEKQEETLITVYDLDYHTYVENDFLKTVYNSKIEKSKPIQYLKAFK